MKTNILDVTDRNAFREWLVQNHATATECYVVLQRGKPKEDGAFYYLDAVEEALCFGWIDSTLDLVDGRRMQRFAPRRAKSNWTELNKARVRRLERLGQMTDAGRAVLPNTDTFIMDKTVEEDIKQAGVWDTFCTFPPLYRRVRAYNLAFTKRTSPEAYQTAFDNFVKHTRDGKTYGQWNDYGRLQND